METEINNEVYNLKSSVYVDNSIESKEYQTFIPQSKANFNTTGHTIEIQIPASDVYYLPAESFLEIKGRLLRENDQAHDAAAQITLINNAVMYMFSSIQYRLGGQVMETLNYPGQTTSMLGLLSYPDDFNSTAGLNQCWSKDTSSHADSDKFQASVLAPAANYRPTSNGNYNEGFDIRRKLLMSADPRGSFSFIIPFSHIFGFSEYTRVVYNLEHILKFVRASDNLAIYRTNDADAGKINLTEIRWIMPKVIPSPIKRSELLELTKKKSVIPLHFCARSDDHTTVNANVRSFEWNLNSSAGVEKPRWLIIGLQTNKNMTQEQNPAIFDHVRLNSVCVKLNGMRYPSDNIDIDYTKNDYVRLYKMAEDFKKEYYGFNNLIGGTQINFH